ncbi:putative DNA binding domain-containing protein [Candidatus Saccharibacteria bacterium]|nr:putative DNA binding domain-containing protein [Candidatus Saccharibacteria bacterium]
MNTRDIDVQELKLLSEKRRITFLRDQKEDQWLDRKSAKVSALKIANAMVGFANAEGGIIVIGIHDGKIEGIKSAGKGNDWRQASLDFTIPPVRHKFEYIECINEAGEKDEIAIIEVEAGERVHTNQRGETFLRVGDENRKLNPREALELMYDKGESTYDGTPIKDAALDDLDGELIKLYIKNVGADEKHATTVLKARGLAKEVGGEVKPTIAGMLTLGKNPHMFLPQATLRVLVYKGSSRETGSRANVIYDRRIEGPLSYQIEQARSELQKILPRAIRLGSESRFGESTLVPEYVWIEAIVNAAIHRSYSIGGDHTRIEIFDDRIEVKSPGRLPGLVRLENIRSTRFARNPRVARALSDIRYGRELGEGVNRMFEEMGIAGLPDPIYTQGSAFVQVVLLEDPLAGRILRHLPPGSERFVEFISREGRITTNEAASLLGVTRPTARKHLHGLAEKKLIEHIGTSVMDPRGYWKIKTGN